MGFQFPSNIDFDGKSKRRLGFSLTRFKLGLPGHTTAFQAKDRISFDSEICAAVFEPIKLFLRNFYQIVYFNFFC